MGFNELNSLSWTFDFAPRRLLEASTFITKKDNLLAETIASTHQILLETTNLKLVFLLGPDAELYVLGPAKNLIKSVIELHGMKYTIFFQSEPGPEKLFIRCPKLPLGMADFISGAVSSFGALVKFASSLTEIPEIRPYRMETGHGLHFIMMQYDRERRGYKHIVANKLQRGMLLWYRRRGYDKSDIHRLSRSARSLAVANILLISNIRQRIQRISGEAFEMQVADDDLRTAVRELQKEDSKAFQTSIDKVASQSDSQYKRALETSTSLIQKRVIEHEYNDMVNLKYFTYLIGDEAEALLDRIEEGAL
jgi:hypothetical protein